MREKNDDEAPKVAVVFHLCRNVPNLYRVEKRP